MKAYAMWNSYGIQMGGLAKDTYLAFDSKKERDEYVKEHGWDGSNCVCRWASRREVEKYVGKNFVTEKMYPDDEYYYCFRK